MRTNVYTLKGTDLNAIRDCIIDNSISEGDTIILGSSDFEQMVLGYKDKFGIGMSFPYSLMGVTLKEDSNVGLAAGKIRVLRESVFSLSLDRRTVL
ncbi:MAG: hypothetical protein WAQ28_18615 [Bacteroidia bacterium]